ncbi:hypothetical protein FRC07_004289, partial [Ceratobasidium sp. 392]
MIALPRSATKALKLWSWKDHHGVVDTREDGLAKRTPKSSFDVHRGTHEELKVDESEPIEHDVVTPIARPPSKLKKRDPSGNESKKDAVLPVPVSDPATTAPDDPSCPATPSTTHAPLSVDSHTAEHVIVPSIPPRPPTPKHNVLVKKNSLSKRAAAKPAVSSSEAPPDLPNKADIGEHVTDAEAHEDVSDEDGGPAAAGNEDEAAVEASTILDSAPTERAESTTTRVEPETPVGAHPFPVRGSTPPNGTRFFEGTDGELEPTESRTTGTGAMSGRRMVRPTRPQRRISLRSFGFFYGKDSRPAYAFPAYVPPTERVVYEEPEVEAGSSSQPAQPRAHKRRTSLIPPVLLSSRKPAAPKVTRTDKRAVESALSLRTLIIGPAAMDPKDARDKGKRSSDSKASAALALRKVNQQLLVPVEANRVIAALRELPPPDLPPATAERVVETVRRKKGWVFGRGGTRGEEKQKQEVAKESEGTVAMPIHGCCLDLTDEEAEEKHFSKLTGSKQEPGNAFTGANANTGSADLSSLIPVLKDMRLVNLQASPDMWSVNAASLSADLTAPDLGFGQPANKNGPLAGSVPSAGSLVEGMEKVGQTLVSLGFPSTTAVLPSHVGVYPPKDRMSVLTYWWGYEVVFPPPTMRYLGAAHSISGALLNFLTAFSLFSNGVREMLPFIRYIAQFIDFEWNAIKAQDKGRGVVCAATWVMPAALVPRPWDFVDPPVMSGMSSKLERSMTPGAATREAFAPVVMLAAPAPGPEEVEAGEAAEEAAFNTEVRDGEAVKDSEIEKVESLDGQEEVGIEAEDATTEIEVTASRHDEPDPAVLSGDTLVLRGPPGPQGQPPKERILHLAEIVSPRMGTASKDDEPWAYDCREFLRQFAVGKPISFTSTFSLPPKDDIPSDFGHAEINGQNVATEVLRAGFGRCKEVKREPTEEDTRRKELETEARNGMVGMWNPQGPKDHNVQYTMPADSAAFINEWKGKNID